MRFSLFFILLGGAFLSFLAGSGELQKWVKKKPKTYFQIVDQKKFVVIFYVHNSANFCERMLRSVFDQNYSNYRILFIDDGSVDGSFERAQQFCLEQEKEESVILMRNELPLGVFQSLVRAINQCLDQEIVILLEGWFAHSEVLYELNQSFQDREIWLTIAPKIEYPTYQILDIQQKREDFPNFSFYAGMFRSLLQEEHTDLSFLLKLAKGHITLLEDPLFFTNLAIPQKEKPLKFKES